MSLTVSQSVGWVEAVSGQQFLKTEIYPVDHLPSDIRYLDIIIVSLVAMLLSISSTLLPALRASKLDPAETEVDRLSQGADHQGLGQPGHAFEQAMTASQHGDQKLFQHVFLSDNYLVNLSFQFFVGLYKGLGHFFVVFGLLGGTHGLFLGFLDL